MSDRLVSLIREASSPLAPVPTDVAPRLAPMQSLRVILWDIYGTLLISGSGDIGSADPTLRDRAFAEALRAVGVMPEGVDVSLLRRQIERAHAAAHAAGIDYPEVDIVEVWRDVLVAGVGADDAARVDLEQLAVEFEIRANPIWPMPGLDPCLSELRRRGLVLGIISNAQFFTPLAIRATTGKTLDEHGFDALLRYYSYEHRRAKPGRWLYEQAAQHLAGGGYQPHEVLYVGNDMRNDVWPAAEVGFRTALFAGDQRSLRLRTNEAESNQFPEPDVVVTDLTQILSIAPGLTENRASS